MRDPYLRIFISRLKICQRVKLLRGARDALKGVYIKGRRFDIITLQVNESNLIYKRCLLFI